MSGFQIGAILAGVQRENIQKKNQHIFPSMLSLQDQCPSHPSLPGSTWALPSGLSSNFPLLQEAELTTICGWDGRGCWEVGMGGAQILPSSHNFDTTWHLSV